MAKDDFVFMAMTCLSRHPGAGRDPVATTLVQASWLLDSGLRRNDGQERDSNLTPHQIRSSGTLNWL
jgi:hypothetical protein